MEDSRARAARAGAVKPLKRRQQAPRASTQACPVTPARQTGGSEPDWTPRERDRGTMRKQSKLQSSAAVWRPTCCGLVVGALAATLGLSACGSNNVAPPGSDAGTDAPEVVLDGGGEVPAPPDGAALCPSGSCNYQTQSGCAATRACRPTLTTGGTITPGCQAAGSKQSDAPCQAWTDCARGYLCAGGACHKLCCGGDWSACSAGHSCIRQLFVQPPDAGTSVSAGVDLCFPVNNCDVLDPNSCGAAGQSCQIVDPIGDVACAPAGSGTFGAPCSETQPCSGGFSCVGDKCRRLCRAVAGGGNPACPTSEGICVHYNRDPAGVGECTPT